MVFALLFFDVCFPVSDYFLNEENCYVLYYFDMLVDFYTLEIIRMGILQMNQCTYDAVLSTVDFNGFIRV